MSRRRVAEETIADVDAAGHWLGKTVTRVSNRKLGSAVHLYEHPASNTSSPRRCTDALRSRATVFMRLEAFG